MSDIQELFARDPLSLSTQDLDAIIDHLRKARASFNLGLKDAGSLKPKAEPKAKATKIALSADILKDLGL